MSTTEDQSETIAFLSRAETYGSAATAVERIETHGAVVFLVGDRAYKLKRAVRYPYMDFSTETLRRAACQREVDINRRTAPDLYLGVLQVGRTRSGALALGPETAACDWLVEMRRFPQHCLLDRMAEAGELSPALVLSLAEEIARFHDKAEILRSADVGGAAGLRWVIEENVEELHGWPDLFAPNTVMDLATRSQTALSAAEALLDARRDAGLVRHCHGDLHLGNVCVLDGAPTLFDAIEFNDAIARIDVFYDLAFLLMDYDHRGLREAANATLNRYLEHRRDLRGLAALPLFLSARAAIRAKVTATALTSQIDSRARHLRSDVAHAYLAAAASYLRRPTPCLVAVGGLSGSGKSTVARRLAPSVGAAPGALHLRSDVARKRLHGVAPTAHLPAAAYTPDATADVYRSLIDDAQTALETGHSVIVDAVHARPEERAALETLAERLGVAFVGIWLDAQRDVLIDRVAARKDDASDATPAVVERQLGYALGTIDWHRIDAARTIEVIAAEARRVIGRAVIDAH
jgi:aminoglycoside phosphotransferase family enzyme/cytidylate kinase